MQTQSEESGALGLPLLVVCSWDHLSCWESFLLTAGGSCSTPRVKPAPVGGGGGWKPVLAHHRLCPPHAPMVLSLELDPALARRAVLWRQADPRAQSALWPLSRQ